MTPTHVSPSPGTPPPDDAPGNAAELRGLNQLTFAGIDEVVDLVEAMHRRISPFPHGLADAAPGRTSGVTGLVYRGVRGAVASVGYAVDGALVALSPWLERRKRWHARERMRAVLNGVVGDYLSASANPLAIPMRFRHAGVALTLEPEALAAAFPDARGTLMVMLHGLCMNDLDWTRDGHDRAAQLGRDLDCTPVYLHYNTGLHISTNGQLLAQQLEALVRAWPVAPGNVVLVGHSMGGLVARSACHYGALAGHEWRRHLTDMVFLGTPHSGALLESAGAWVETLLRASPYAAPLARLGTVRSAGITDLRFGDIVDEDWTGAERRARRGRHVEPRSLPADVACFAVAATLARRASPLHDRLLGDGLVTVPSAFGRHRDLRRALKFDKSRQHIVYGTGHLELLGSPAVYAQLRRWLRR